MAKEEILREYEKSQVMKKNDCSHNEFLMTGLSFVDNDDFTKIINKNKEIIKKTVVDIEESFKEGKAIETRLKLGEEIRQKAKSELGQRRRKIAEVKEKQKQNYENLKILQEKSTRNYYRIHTALSSPRKIISRTRLMTSPQAHSRECSFTEFEISDRILKYEEKMNKSKLLHELVIRNKKQAASKLLERNEKFSKTIETNKEFEVVERISKLISKNKTAGNRRYLILKKQEENREKMREKHDERKQRAQTKIREREIFDKEKVKAIEKRMKISSGLLEKKQINWNKELELRNEMQRLKDEEAMLNAERKRRIMYNLYRKYRRDLVLEKQISDSQRIQAIKKNKEDGIKKKMDIAILSMKEKEKLKQILETIKKTPVEKILTAKSKKVEIEKIEEF